MTHSDRPKDTAPSDGAEADALSTREVVAAIRAMLGLGPTPERRVRRRHHWVPEFYLERWAENGKIRVANRGDGTWRDVAPDQAANQRDFYTFVGDDGEETDFLEDVFGKIEGDAARAIRNTCNLLVVPGQRHPDRQAIAHFMALQEFRTPEFFRRSELMDDAMAKMMLTLIAESESVSSALERAGVEPTETNIQSFQQFARHPDAFEATTGRKGGIKLMLSMFARAVPLFEGMYWNIVRWDRPSLITGDHPIVKRPRPDTPQWMGTGLMNAAEVWFPLGPSHALVMTWDELPEAWLEGTAEWASNLNRAIRHASYLDVFCAPSMTPGLPKKGLGARALMRMSGPFPFLDRLNEPPERLRPKRR